MKYIGLLSDTHGVFDTKVQQFLEPVDEIWHAGDIGSPQLADTLAQFKPMKGVYGNCDSHLTRYIVPYYQDFECEGMRVLMMHIGGYPNKYDHHALQLITERQPQIFVCGHSHILKVVNDKTHNMIVINPGAAGVQGFHLVRTALRFHIDNGKIIDMEVGQWEKTISSTQM